MKKERAKTLISKNKNEPSAARALYVSLDRADNVIEGSIKGDVNKKHISLRIRGEEFLTSSPFLRLPTLFRSVVGRAGSWKFGCIAIRVVLAESKRL
jgi:hypothetical protein